MECKVLLLLLQLSCLQYVYMRGFDCPNACGRDEVKVPCGNDGKKNEVPCPGTRKEQCTYKGLDCTCPRGSARKKNRMCVAYEECFQRTFRIRDLVDKTPEIFLVGLTAPLDPGTTYSCIKSTYKHTTSNRAIERYLEYYVDNHNGTWTNRKHHFVFEVKDSRSHKPYLEVRQYGKDTNDFGIERHYEVLISTPECIVLGKTPRSGPKTQCTAWATRTPLPKSCEEVFNFVCESPRIILTDEKNECEKH